MDIKYCHCRSSKVVKQMHVRECTIRNGSYFQLSILLERETVLNFHDFYNYFLKIQVVIP